MAYAQNGIGREQYKPKNTVYGTRIKAETPPESERNDSLGPVKWFNPQGMYMPRTAKNELEVPSSNEYIKPGNDIKPVKSNIRKHYKNYVKTDYLG